jgi:hypothetical protein
MESLMNGKWNPEWILLSLLWLECCPNIKPPPLSQENKIFHNESKKATLSIQLSLTHSSVYDVRARFS